MLVIVGAVIVFVAMLGGFMMAGGQLKALAHASEFVVIGGISLGMLIIASPKQILMNLLHDIQHELSSKGVGRDDFIDLLKILYEIFMIGRRNGLIALDEHMSDPKSSSIFTKYPSVLNDKERVEFLVSALRPIIDGKIKPDQLQEVLESEIEAKEAEAHHAVGVLSLVADSLPGIGIVAAVLGIINTMNAISEGPEKVGEKVAAALTGTLLGVFFAYGFANPLARKIGFSHAAHFQYFYVMAKAISGFAKGLAPMMAIEIARRSLDKAIQPSAEELETMLKALGGGGGGG